MNVVKDIWSIFAALLTPAYSFSLLPRQYGKHTTVVTYMMLEHHCAPLCHGSDIACELTAEEFELQMHE